VADESPARAQLDAPLPEERGRAWQLIACLALVALPFLAGLRGGFVYDDLAMVVRNPRITSFSHLPEILTSPMLDFLDPQEATKIGYWRPVAGVALITGYTLGAGTPIGFKLVSLLLHLAATGVAFRLARRLTRSGIAAFFAALLFGLHPTHVEGVTWISAINDPLFGLFSLLSLDAFVAWRDAGSNGTAWKAAAWLVLALLSKEMGAAVVPMAIALDLGRSSRLRPFARAYVPLAIAVFAYLFARMLVFGDLYAGLNRTTTDFGVLPLRLFQLRFELFGGFLWLLAWPSQLNLFRPFRPEVPLGDPEFVRAIACIGVLCLLAWWLWKRRDGLAFACVLLLAAAVSPALVRPQSLGTFPLSDRFLYLAALGWGILVTLAALRYLPRRAAVAALALVALAYGARVYARTGFWRDEVTLFGIAAQQSPRSPYVHWGFARTLLQRFQEKKDVDALRLAHVEAATALDLLEKAQKGDQSIYATSNDHIQSNLSLGWSLLKEADVDEYHDYATVLRVFEAVASRYPDSADAQAGLGVAAMQLHRYDEAETALRKAIELNPSNADAHHNRGLLKIRRNDMKGAAQCFEEALRHRPDDLDDLLLLAQTRVEGGDRAGAIAAAARAQERHPRSAGPLVILGTIAAGDGKLGEALEYAQKALGLEPDDGKALILKSKILFARGEKAGAKLALLRAAELLPENFEAHYNAGALLLQEGDLPAALPYLVRAYGLRRDDATGKNLHDQLVAISLTDADVLSRLATADADRGDEADALEWLDRAIERKADHGPALFMKAMLLEKCGDSKSAEELLRKACAAMPESFDANEQLGQLLAKASRNAEAIPFLERALESASRAAQGVPGGEESLADLRATVERLKSAAK
jgi:tetratricopeptide (TPR) repeat protein